MRWCVSWEGWGRRRGGGEDGYVVGGGGKGGSAGEGRERLGVVRDCMAVQLF